MANILNKEKQVAVISSLAEGASIRAIERMTGIHRDTIMRLGVRVGNSCIDTMDKTMWNLRCQRVQLDEIWGFIGKKQKHLKIRDPRSFGDVYTFVALDADTKLVPCFRVGKRNLGTARAFINDLSSRLENRIQLSTDSLSAYIDAVEEGFGAEIDYGQIVKTYTSSEAEARKYSPPTIVKVDKEIVTGNPDPRHISTSFIEAQNLTIRMHCRRLTRLTNAFSKKLDNFKTAMGLHFAYYNFVKVHRTLRATPAMAAGVVSSQWTVADLVERAN